MAIAMRASVTVSIAEAMIGMLSGMARVNFDRDVRLRRQNVGQTGFQQHVIKRESFANTIIRLSDCHRQLRSAAPCRHLASRCAPFGGRLRIMFVSMPIDRVGTGR